MLNPVDSQLNTRVQTREDGTPVHESTLFDQIEASHGTSPPLNRGGDSVDSMMEPASGQSLSFMVVDFPISLDESLLVNEYLSSSRSPIEHKSRQKFIALLKAQGAYEQGDQIICPGDLRVEGLSCFDQFIPHLKVCGDLSVIGCDYLWSLSDDLEVEGSLLLDACKSLRGFGESTQVGKDLLITDCNSIIQMRPNEGSTLKVGGRLGVFHCSTLSKMNTTDVQGQIFLFGLSSLEYLPKALYEKPEGDENEPSNCLLYTSPSPRD